MCLIHKTDVIGDPGGFDVGIRVETHKESIGDKWFLYSQVITWFGADKSITAVGDKTYLQGTIEGLEQVINLELCDEALSDVSDKWHEAIVLATEELKDAYKYQFFAAVARSM